jgi:hypothetical protein
MPILDKPYTYIKWSSPTEVVQTKPSFPPSCNQLAVVQGLIPTADLRGGSQLIRWGDNYIAITHEVFLSKNYMGQKDGVYRHRLCVWDSEFKLVGVSPEPWSFLDAKIEFVCGAAIYGDDLLLSWGFQDNAAMVLQIPGRLVDEMITEALNGN